VLEISRGKRKPRHGFGVAFMPERLPLLGWPQQPDMGLLRAGIPSSSKEEWLRRGLA
jgi:hypothetical protein